jgi:hypothetical protein
MALRTSTRRRAALASLTLAGALAAATLPATAAFAAPPTPPQDLGPNVVVFDPSMPQSLIQAKVDAIAAQQVGNQFGPQRYALLFAPGTYGSPQHPLTFQVGYYTEVAGLGHSPDDVTINGAVNVVDSCADPSDRNSCNALNNFWRSISNLHIA